jgi:hypothetical protein
MATDVARVAGAAALVLDRLLFGVGPIFRGAVAVLLLTLTVLVHLPVAVVVFGDCGRCFAEAEGGEQGHAGYAERAEEIAPSSAG